MAMPLAAWLTIKVIIIRVLTECLVDWCGQAFQTPAWFMPCIHAQAKCCQPVSPLLLVISQAV
jgi:hypothetical protein